MKHFIASISKKLFTVILGLVLALVILEIGLRLFWSPAKGYYGFSPNSPFQPDAVAGQKFKPNWKGEYFQEEFNQHFVTNSLGFASSEEYITAQSGEVIAVLGDSFVSGLQIDEKQRFTNILEASVQENPLAWGDIQQIQNYGVDSSGIVHYLQVYRAYARPHHPSIVVITIYTGNDLNNTSPVDLGDYYHLRPTYLHDENGNIIGVAPFPEATLSPTVEWMSQNIALFRFAVIMALRGALNDQLGLPVTYYYVYQDPWNETFQEAWTYADWALENLISDIQGDNALPIILHIPTREMVVSEAWNETVQDFADSGEEGELVRTKFSSQLKDWATIHDVLYVDATETIQKAVDAGEVVYLKEDRHLTKRGHELVAQLLLEFLQKLSPK